MKINYNKRSSFLQGSGDLVEEVNRALQMVKRVNAENQVKRMLFGRKGVGGPYLKINSVSDPFISRISFCKINHDRGKVNPLKPNPWNCLGQIDGENSRTRSDIDGSTLLNSPRYNSLEDPSAGKSHIPSGHPVVIFREFLILNDTGF